MKLNVSKLLLTVGLSFGIVFFASVVQARIQLNGSTLSGKKTDKQVQPPSDKFSINDSSLSGK